MKRKEFYMAWDDYDGGGLCAIYGAQTNKAAIQRMIDRDAEERAKFKYLKPLGPYRIVKVTVDFED